MFTTVRVKCLDQALQVNAPRLASGGLNEIQITAEFCPLWDGLGKTAVFFTDASKSYHVLMEDDACIVPAEVTAAPGAVYFGIIGSGDNRTRTSEVKRLSLVQGPITEGEAPADPTPDIYAQLLAYYGRMQAMIEQMYLCASDDGTGIVTLAFNNDAGAALSAIDALCPSFEESGGLVTCEPVVGYPLTVAASEEATQITRCGKNLFDFKQAVSLISFQNSQGTRSERYGYDIYLPAGTYRLAAYGTSTNRYIYGTVEDAEGNTKQACNLVTAASYTPQTVTIADGDIIKIYNGVSQGTEEGTNSIFRNAVDIQIEAGKTATAYEPYCGETFAPGELIPALAGVNCLYADAGEITVSGKSDLVAIINKLTKAIIALGGTV